MGRLFGKISFISALISTAPLWALNGANQNGNPGFEIEFKIQGHPAHCQATLVKRIGNRCYLATAAHCMDDIDLDSNQRFTLTTADSVFGEVLATRTLNQDYGRVELTSGHKLLVNDTALISFVSPSCANPTVKVMALEVIPQKETRAVYWASRHQNGLFLGTLKNMPLPVADGENGVKMSRAAVYIEKSKTAPNIYKGDSGGGIFIRNGAGYALVGILSFYMHKAEHDTKDGSPTVWATTNSGIQSLNRELKKLSESSESE